MTGSSEAACDTAWKNASDGVLIGTASGVGFSESRMLGVAVICLAEFLPKLLAFCVFLHPSLS